MSEGPFTRSSETRNTASLGRSGGSPAPAEGAVPAPDEKTVISRRPAAAPIGPSPIPMKPSEVGRSLVGQTLGHFHLEEFVGGGGMGAVFRAIDTTLGRTVAVKVVANQNADEDMLRRFRNEAQSAARLDHPNIARVYYVGEERGWNYIVFEFIEGVNIRDLVAQRGPLPAADAISFTLQTAEALEHAADRDVVHRDIKPSNILVMPDGRAKLVDMGLARLHQVDAPSQDLTETGVTLGTFDYISPEQARDPRSADVRSDLYSLGCTLYFMLTGMPPFPEGTVLQKLLSHNGDPPPDPRDMRHDLDDELAEISLRLMAKLPSQRFQSPAELIDRLLLLSDRLGVPHERRFAVKAAPAITSWREMLLRQVPWVAPACLLFVAVASVEAFWPAPPVVSHESLRPVLSVPEGRVVPSAPPVAGSSEPTASPDSRPDPTLVPESAASLDPADSTPRTGGESGGLSPGISPVTKRPTASPPAPVTSLPADVRPMPEVRPAVPNGNRSDAESLASPTSPVDPVVTTPVPEPASDPTSLSVGVGTGSLPSVEAAFQQVSASSQIETILLRFRQRVESPLVLAPRSSDKELTIRGEGGQAPLIIFRPQSAEVPDRACFRLIGGKVNFVDVHFRLELTSAAGSDWSLFHLRDSSRVTFTNCSLTIHNEPAGNTAFFAIDGPTPDKMMMPVDPIPVSTGPLIGLKSTVVRGDANLARAVQGLPFKLNWSQGFLATSRPVIVARGLRDNQGAMLIQLKFSRVTGFLGAGLCTIDVDSVAPVVPDLRVETSHCVWLQKDPTVPLVEHRGVENIEQVTQNRFRYAGEQNLYPATTLVWRIQARSGEIIEHPWRDPSPGIWYTEGSVDKGVRWLRALPGEGRATFTYSFHDFQLEPELANMAGFDDTSLPELREPESDSTPAESPTPPPAVPPMVMPTPPANSTPPIMRLDMPL